MFKGSSSFLKFAKMCEQVRFTPGKLRKIQIVADYFQSLESEEDLAIAASFLSGKIFAPGSESQEINVGYSMLWKSIAHSHSIHEEELAMHHRKYGDLGSAIEDYLSKTSCY